MLGTVGCAGVAALGVLPVGAQGSGTPEATPGGVEMGLNARERLRALLALVPRDRLTVPGAEAWLFAWTDLQTQLAALGNPDLMTDTESAIPVTSPLFLSDPLAAYAMLPEAKEAFGFSSFQIHQTMTTGTPPDQVTYYAGGAPVDTLPATWESAGYERKHGDAGDYWTIGENGELDLDTAVGQIGKGQLNNIAIVSDEVIVFAPRLELLQAVQQLAANGGSSAADDDNLATLLGVMPDDAVSVVALPGASLDATTIVPENPGAQASQTLADLLAESDDAVGSMPESTMALFGVTAGAVSGGAPDVATPAVQGNPDAFIFADLLTGSPDDAVQTGKVVLWRVQHMMSPTTGVAFSDLLVPDDAERQESTGSIAAFAFTSPKNLSVWTQMIGARDMWPFVYLTGE